MATVVKENSSTFKLLKKQIERDIESEAILVPDQYEYRLNMVETFSGKKITVMEAEQLKLMLEPYAPSVEEEVPVTE